jgi:hypothetical protein
MLRLNLPNPSNFVKKERQLDESEVVLEVFYHVIMQREYVSKEICQYGKRIKEEG